MNKRLLPVFCLIKDDQLGFTHVVNTLSAETSCGLRADATWHLYSVNEVFEAQSSICPNCYDYWTP